MAPLPITLFRPDSSRLLFQPTPLLNWGIHYHFVRNKFEQDTSTRFKRELQIAWYSPVAYWAKIFCIVSFRSFRQGWGKFGIVNFRLSDGIIVKHNH